MSGWARQAGTWIGLIAVVAVVGGGLAFRANLSGSQSPTPSPTVAAAAVAGASPTLAKTEARVPRPTRAPATPRATSTPAASTATPVSTPSPPAPAPPVPATPAPVAAAPQLAQPAPAAPTPVPVHDNEPVLLTEKRVDGAFGQTLTVDGYSVSAVRASAPSAACFASLGLNAQVFDVTITYSGPIHDVHFAVAGSSWAWCMDAEGSAAQKFPSGVTQQIVVATAEGYPPTSDAPLTAWVTAVNGSHTMTFAFH